jgi:flavin reductase (DIM6/NTAB) family NADH-FMN oxidoreductase RutF
MSSNPAHLCPAPVDSNLFRSACSRFATGITVVTVLGPDGLPHGMTANSFTSVSLDPPLVLVCIDRKAAMLPRLEAATHFGINVLSEEQEPYSAHFARPGMDRFEGIQWFPGELGVPLLHNVLATYECAVSEVIEAGDHRIFIGEVRHLRCYDGHPLIYFGSRYRTLAG